MGERVSPSRNRSIAHEAAMKRKITVRISEQVAARLERFYKLLTTEFGAGPEAATA